VLLSVHRAEAEHCSLNPVAANIKGHGYRVTAGRQCRNGVPPIAGSGQFTRAAPLSVPIKGIDERRLGVLLVQLI
jgi:hypothetical protein